VKSKTTAVVLAVFLGIWSWAYTYELNKKKFWSSLISYLALSVVIWLRIAYSAFQMQQGIYSSEVEAIFWRTVGFVWLVSPVGLSIWAIIDNAVKPSSFFKGYPKKPLG
jgi:Na+/H+-dicarboxylate symporter